MIGRVGVAISGGVDSAVVALLLMREGWDVIGYHLLMSGCQSVAVVREVGKWLGIRVEVVDVREEFLRITDGFVRGYERGWTPNPCVVCNPEVKIRGLWAAAEGDGCDVVATGHYVRREFDWGRWVLKRGIDKDKDQSYFLYRLGQELSRILFPLGELVKSEVREIAAEAGLPVADREESQDNCFVGPQGYSSYVERYGMEKIPGVIVDLETDQIVGEHSGIHQFTPGQRRGLGLSVSGRRYVVRIDESSGTVYVGDRRRVMARAVLIGDVVIDREDQEFRTSVQHRYRSEETMATVIREHGQMRVVFDTEQFAPARGQSLVMYDGDVVVGGGTICETEFVG